MFETAQAPQYIFKSSGTYTVKLQIINDDGLTHSVEETIEITAFTDPISFGQITSPAYLFLIATLMRGKERSCRKRHFGYRAEPRQSISSYRLR